MSHDLVGYELPTRNGGDNGARVLAYDYVNNVLVVIPIKWSNGAVIGEQVDIDSFKLMKRYDVDNKRLSKPRQLGE
jgi:hypothetical protein